MRKDDKVTILPSKELAELKLYDLCGRKAIVIEILESEGRKIRGCWVKLIGEPFKGEIEWYIPISSII